jgi:hypothetical protein
MQATSETIGQLAVDAYIECALWAGLDISREDEGGHNPPLDANFGPDDLSEEAYQSISREVRDFLEANEADIWQTGDEFEIDPEQIGHDFYLTRNGHGAGFWDRGLGELGDRLAAAAKVYGSSELYPGDDGRLYVGG